LVIQEIEEIEAIRKEIAKKIGKEAGYD